MDDEEQQQPSGGPQPQQEPARYEYKPPEKPQPAPAADDWKRVVRPQQGKRSRRLYGALVAIIIVAFAAGFFVFNPSSLTGMFVAGQTAQNGDAVRVLYTGRLQSGKVFDTNIEAVAKAAGLSQGTFQPLEFTVGAGFVIPGFDDAVTGMRKGEKKTVTIPPEKAYGPKDPARIITAPRTTEFNRTETISLLTWLPADQFISLFGAKKVGEEFTVPQTSLRYRVVNVSNETGLVTAQFLVQTGGVYRFPGFAWNATVLNISGTNATIRNDPGETQIRTEFGNTTLIYLEDKIVARMFPVVGGLVQIQPGFPPGRITAVDDANVTIDFNGELAGETLTFDIELLDITTPSPAANTSGAGA